MRTGDVLFYRGRLGVIVADPETSNWVVISAIKKPLSTYSGYFLLHMNLDVPDDVRDCLLRLEGVKTFLTWAGIKSLKPQDLLREAPGRKLEYIV